MYYYKTPLICGGYKDVSQAARSFKQLLQNAELEGDANIYIIGVDDRIFEELMGKYIPEEPAGSGSRKDSGKLKSLPDHLSNDETSMSARQLLDLLPKIEVPETLSGSYLGESPEISLVRHLIMPATLHDDPVLILGESGTGKEIVARSIHDYGHRRNGRFIAVNCGAISPMLFESELFGHVRGAFTDAGKDKKGLWEIANGGTLFLDEIGDLTLDHQVKILRVMQEGTIRPVGATRDSKIDTRIIAATNRDLNSMAQSGQFREDLYYRLRFFLIRTPALRHHPDDIPILAQAFWKNITKNEASRLPGEIESELKKYSWSGSNARELKMVLSNLYTLFGRERLSLENLRAIWHIQGLDTVFSQKSVTGKEMTFHRIEHLRHLNRLEELLRAIKLSLEPILLDGKPRSSRSQTVMRISVQNNLDELEALCSCPGLFRSARIPDLALELYGSLKAFAPYLAGSARQALLYWTKEVSSRYKNAQTAILQEIEKLI